MSQKPKSPDVLLTKKPKSPDVFLFLKLHALKQHTTAMIDNRNFLMFCFLPYFFSFIYSTNFPAAKVRFFGFKNLKIERFQGFRVSRVSEFQRFQGFRGFRVSEVSEFQRFQSFRFTEKSDAYHHLSVIFTEKSDAYHHLLVIMTEKRDAYHHLAVIFTEKSDTYHYLSVIFTEKRDTYHHLLQVAKIVFHIGGLRNLNVLTGSSMLHVISRTPPSSGFRTSPCCRRCVSRARPACRSP